MLAFGYTQAFMFVSVGSLQCAMSAQTAIWGRQLTTKLNVHSAQTSNRTNYDQLEDDPAEDAAKPVPIKTA